MPPYAPLIEWLGEQALAIKLHLANFSFLMKDPLYTRAYLTSLEIASVSTVFCLLIGYPMAYGIARAPPAWRNVLLMMVVLPFWTSFLLRVYAWIGLLRSNGVINNVLMALGIIDQPLVMLQTEFAVYVGIVYSYLPFMCIDDDEQVVGVISLSDIAQLDGSQAVRTLELVSAREANVLSPLSPRAHR